jgi:hypothetical protein
LRIDSTTPHSGLPKGSPKQTNDRAIGFYQTSIGIEVDISWDFYTNGGPLITLQSELKFMEKIRERERWAAKTPAGIGPLGRREV